MEMRTTSTPPELSCPDDKAFATVQAQLALRGIEVHRVTGAYGREAFTVNVQGSLRTLDTLPQVSAYARCLGVPLMS